MYLLILGILVLIILIEVAYFRVGGRKKIIDQLESDVRIFLVLILIMSSYVLFISIALMYFKIFAQSHQLAYAVLGIYFCSPPVFGILLYVFIPWLYTKNLQLEDIRAPDTIHTLSTLLGLPVMPAVKTSSKIDSPLVYGRSGKSSTLVLSDAAFLADKEQAAAIAHELSHIRQGDVGFFTWLTLLIKGLLYWLLLFPLVVYFMYMYSGGVPGVSTGFVILVPLFFVSLALLKNSLSRIRESIADAYVVFHGLSVPFKRALFKYAAVRTAKKRANLHLGLFGAGLHPLMRTHPPLQKRLYDIEKKTFLTEELTNLSIELAFWTGVAAAFFFHALFRTIINISVAFDLSLFSDSVWYILWFIMCFSVATVVAGSYVFPVSKGSSLFLNLSDSDFVTPLLRNSLITLIAAAVISYGLSFDTHYVWQVCTAVFSGFLLWILGFTGARRTDFSHGEQYLVLAPLSWALIFWYPLKAVHSLVGDLNLHYYLYLYDPLSLGLSLLSILVLALVIILILMEKGKLLMNRNEKILMLFWKREFCRMNDFTFVFLVLLMLLVPAVVSFGVYIGSCFLDSLKILPVRNWFMYSFILIFGMYGLKNSDILFFSKIAFLVDIISGQKEISDKNCCFIDKVMVRYQSADGGFDYSGTGFSNQKDTYYFLKTANVCRIQLQEKKRIVEWLRSTEGKGGGCALFAGGNPRVKGLYYAVHSVWLLGCKEDMSHHVKWIHEHFTQNHFRFPNDTDSLLLQTCYALESLVLLNRLDTIDLDMCKKWIEAHFLKDLSPKDAFFAVRGLKILSGDMKRVEKWIDKHKKLLGTRVDKNLEEVYYYVKVLREAGRKVPQLIVEQAVTELAKTREEYKSKI